MFTSQVGKGLNFDPTQMQWANLTALYKVPCLWIPSECYSGATLAMWLKTRKTGGGFEGIFGTSDNQWKSEKWMIIWTDDSKLGYLLMKLSFSVFCITKLCWYWIAREFEEVNYSSADYSMHDASTCISCNWWFYCRLSVYTRSQIFYLELVTIPVDWFHCVFIFWGPTSGTSLHINGSLTGHAPIGAHLNTSTTSGDVVLGREYGEIDVHYADVSVDELYFWTQPLDAAAIWELYSWY